MGCYVKKPLVEVGGFELLFNYWFHRVPWGCCRAGPPHCVAPTGGCTPAGCGGPREKTPEGPASLFYALQQPPWRVKTTKRREVRTFSGRERERNKAQARAPGAQNHTRRCPEPDRREAQRRRHGAKRQRWAIGQDEPNSTFIRRRGGRERWEKKAADGRRRRRGGRAEMQLTVFQVA